MNTQKRNRAAYIAEAALEYFISILITDAFLATLLRENGVADGAIGIITQLASFSFVAQLASMFLHRSRFKRFVTVLHLANQLLFCLLYMVPVFPISQTGKAVLLVAFFLGGQLLANFVSPYKISWLMSYVPDKERGRFTASKEIVSLAGGMIFSYLMGWVSDSCKAAGREDVSFVICGVTILVLAVLHTASLLLVREEDKETAPAVPVSNGKESLFSQIRSVLGDPTILKLLVVDLLWHAATGISVSFYGTYKTGELGFSMRFIAILSVVYSVTRILFSRPFGTYADKKSWAKLLTLCFAIAALSFFVNIFTVPACGAVLFTIHYALYAISMAGINSGLMNVIFDFVPNEKRPAALGVKYAAGGIVAFLAAILGNFILTAIQNHQNTLFGFPLYAQQLLSAAAFLLSVLLVLYTRFVVQRLTPYQKNENE